MLELQAIIILTMIITSVIIAVVLSMINFRPKLEAVTNNLPIAIDYIKEELKKTNHSYLAVFGETSPYVICQLINELRDSCTAGKDIKFVFSSELYIQKEEDRTKIYKDFFEIKNIKKYKHKSKLKCHFRVVDNDYVYLEDPHLIGKQNRRALRFVNNTSTAGMLKQKFEELLQDSKEVTDPEKDFPLAVKDFLKEPCE